MAVTQDTLITAKTAAENSADFTVDTGIPKTLTLYIDETNKEDFGPHAGIALQRKCVGGYYQPVGVILSLSSKQVSVTGAGTYRLVKPVTVKKLGVQADY